MTEKQYVKENFYDEYAIKKKGTIIAIVDSGSNARKICNELNVLSDENEQLKQSNKELLLLVDTLKEQNMKFKTRLNDLGVEYYD